ncbi:hypothetical protein Bca4012_004437 [Brassica carinata]
MLAEGMSKLEGIGSTERERLWPELVQSFKDIFQRLKPVISTEGEEEEYINILKTEWRLIFTIVKNLENWKR